MPYVDNDAVIRLSSGGRAETPGELNYRVTVLCDEYIVRFGKSYGTLNAVIGVLECAKQELYRRVVAQYEDRKMVENGDVYRSEG